MPSTGAFRTPLLVFPAVSAIIGLGVGYLFGFRAGATHDRMMTKAAEAQRVAFVREHRCGGETCEALWIGAGREDATEVLALNPKVERGEEVVVAKDGYRIGIVVNGYQFRVFDGQTRKFINEVNLLEPDPNHTPSSRVARGVTFSTNGAAVTFDDCPRGQSGCKSGLKAIR